ncbi:uncharacterized protein LOC144902603 isoform X1 [Branchiostoma floridae x Branchiostoma belcheri]
MRSRQTAKQAAADDGESRGRRKLEFAAGSSSKPAQPLAGKVFFLDLRGYGALNIKKLETNIVLLGGSVVNFFDKDVGVTHVISNQDGAKKDQPSGTVDSPAASTPSPFSAATSVRRSSRGNLQSPAVDSPSNPGSSSAVSRGKAIARKAMDTQKQGSSNVLSIAKQLKLKVKHIDVAAQWIEEQAAKLKKSGVKGPQKPARPSENTSKAARKLKPPFVKFEDSSHQYRPVYEELPKFPRVNVDTPRGTCPFDGGAYQDVPVAERSKEEASQAEEREGGTGKKSEHVPKPSPKKKVQHKAASKKATTSQSRSKASVLKAKKNAGYCECCMLKYSDLQQHVKGDQHRAFVKRQENYLSLDRRIRKGPVLDRFLKDVMKYHPIDKTRALQSPGWPEDSGDSGERQEAEDQDDVDDVILISDPVPESVATAPKWPTPAMRKAGITSPSIISSLYSMSKQTEEDKQNCGEGSSSSSLRNLSDDQDEEERKKRKHRKKMAKLTTPQKVFGSSPEKRFPALDRLVSSVENKLEKRKSSDQGSQCSTSKRQRLEVCDGSPKREKTRETEKSGKSPKPAQKSLQRLLKVEERNERQRTDEVPSGVEHSLLNVEQNVAQEKASKPSEIPSTSNVRPRRSPRERNLSTNEQSQEKVEPLSQEGKRSAEAKTKHKGCTSDHGEQASTKKVEKETAQSTQPMTPEKRHSLAEIQATPIRGTDELERRQKELVRSPSPVISPETRQSLRKDNSAAVLGSSVNTSTPLRTQKQRTETAETQKSLPQRRSPVASVQPKIKPAQESAKREPGRKALRKTKHLEDTSEESFPVHKQDLKAQATRTDECAALLMTSELSAEFLGFDLTVSEADRIWQQASGVDASRRALFEASSDKSEIFEIDFGGFLASSEGSEWDKPVTGFISAELTRKVSVSTAVLSPRDSDKENQEHGAEGKNFFTKDLSGNLLSDVRLRRLELERRMSQGKLSQTRSFCEIAGLPPMPEPHPAPKSPLPKVEEPVHTGKTPEAKEANHACDSKPLDLLDHIDQPQVQPGPSRTARTKGKSPKYIVVEEEVGLEDVESVDWSDCEKEEVQDFRLKVRNPQTNEVHILKAAKPLQLENPFYIMSAPTTHADLSGYRVETGTISPTVSPKGKVKYKPSPKKVLQYKSKEVLLKSPVKNSYSRPVPEVPESAVRRIMDDLGFTGPHEGYGYQGTPRHNRRLSEVGLTDGEYNELIDSVINSPRWVQDPQLVPQLELPMSSNVDALDLLDDWNTLISEDTTEFSSDPCTVSQENLSLSQEDPTVSQEDPTTVLQKDPTVSQKDPTTVVQEDPAVSQKDPTLSQKDPTVSQKDPTVSQKDPTVSQKDPTVSQHHGVAEKQKQKGSSQQDSSPGDGIWEKLERWVSEGSSDVSSLYDERPCKQTKEVSTSPVQQTESDRQEHRKQSSKLPQRSGKSEKQRKQDPNQTQAGSSKPTNKSQKSSPTLPNENKGIQYLKAKYMKRPPGPSRYNIAKGRYRKIMKLPIRRPAQATRKEKPVRKKPSKKPTRRSPRVILRRLNLQNVQTTAAGDIEVAPIGMETVTNSQARQQTNQAVQRTAKVKRRRGRPPKQDVNVASMLTNQGAAETPTKRKRGRPRKEDVISTASTPTNRPGQSKMRKEGRTPKVDVNAQSGPSQIKPVGKGTLVRSTQSSPHQTKSVGKSLPVQRLQNSPGQRNSVEKSPNVPSVQNSPRQQVGIGKGKGKFIQSVQNNPPHQMKPVGKGTPVQPAQNSPRQRKSVGNSPPVQSVQNSPRQAAVKGKGKGKSAQSMQNSPRQRKSVGKSPPVQSMQNSPQQRNSVGKSPSRQRVLSRKNLDIPSSPDAVASPPHVTPKRKQMDSPDRWTSPRKKMASPASPTSPEPSQEKKTETPSPNVRRGRTLKKRIPECRNK